ncbi:hypothetical protein L226DRAFT_244981 [Lentinus tigrinus ALCF2SS1-7]|uniref:Uncharacterized protein n=1 Tax=Lentinus tigrinus ALCF2SS1-6 TaxID=1328759 RepID=A0A5C2SNG2_9APHY|nr:hypothetical protein L227DRAFT_570671 [Lentinus tigrinus ALCF2SS1-6]RPD79248.1 hypothetical protein L226DRAFT_244981 [Lentinus tigrinus ALCF2SS1-7]
MLAATFVVVWRSRPSAVAAAHAKRERKSIDIERLSPVLPHKELNSASLTMVGDYGGKFGVQFLGKEKTLEDREERGRGNGDTSMESTTSSDEDPASPVTPVCPIVPPPAVAHPDRSHSVASTVNLIISPSVPHLVKLGADGALEVRVTPPSPVLMPAAGSLRIGGIPGTPGENDSVWWVI